MSRRRSCRVSLSVAVFIAVLVPVVGAANALPAGSVRAAAADVTPDLARAALPAPVALEPDRMWRLFRDGSDKPARVAPCIGGRRMALADTSSWGADYGTPLAPGVDANGASWAIQIFVYVGIEQAHRDLQQVATAEHHCRKRSSDLDNGVLWSVRHVGGTNVTSTSWVGYRIREAESTLMKHNSLLVTSTYWSRGNVLVLVEQVVPASRSRRTADAWLDAADTAVLSAL